MGKHKKNVGYKNVTHILDRIDISNSGNAILPARLPHDLHYRLLSITFFVFYCF